MIKEKAVLAIIPARGGSKGVPRKNIRDLVGKPLIAWTIETAQQSKYIDRLILSSEDNEIVRVAKKWGCEVPFVRPLELAQDTTPGIEPVIHAVNTLKESYDYVVLLQPTSPLRTIEDIDACIEMCIERNVPACVSVCEAEHSPYWMFTLGERGKMKKLIDLDNNYLRRQDIPSVYRLNGAVYVAKTEFILKNKSFLTDETAGYIMSIEHSIDIDTEKDFRFAELLLQKKGHNYKKQKISRKL